MAGITLKEFMVIANNLIAKHPELVNAILMFEGNSMGQEMFYVDRIERLKDKYILNEIRNGRSPQTLAIVLIGEETV